MTPVQLSGLALIVVGLLDPLIAVYLIGPKIADPRQRRVIVVSFAITGFLLVVLGVLFLLQVLGT